MLRDLMTVNKSQLKIENKFCWLLESNVLIHQQNKIFIKR